MRSPCVRGRRSVRELERADVAIDAIFGTGFRGTPAGPYAEAIEALAGSSVPLVAVDIPSGVNGETGAVEGPAVRADLTVTFGAPKPGLVLLPGATHAGVVEVEPIGFPVDLIRSDLVLVEAEDVAAMLPLREPDTHKRSAGYAVVVGGSRLMTGAVALAGAAAYRAGAGLVAVAVPESILPVTQGAVREAVFVALPETDAGTAAGGSARLDEVLGQAGSLAVGPGMTTDERTAGWIRAAGPFERGAGRPGRRRPERVRRARRRPGRSQGRPDPHAARRRVRARRGGLDRRRGGRSRPSRPGARGADLGRRCS